MIMYKTALVLGLGASGEAAARLLLDEGTVVTVVDWNDDGEIPDRAQNLKKKGAVIVIGKSDLPEGDFEVCITSPGVQIDSDWIRSVESRKIQVLSELELGAARCRCPLLAVTGSNGKSSMVKLCGDALSLAGYRTALAGNYGPPLCNVAGTSRNLDWVVVEVSSFQLERIGNFRPRVAVLLNVQSDHLDRHGTIEKYFEIKTRVFGGTERDQYGTRSLEHGTMERDIGIVLDEISEKIIERSEKHRRWVTFGLSRQADYRYDDGMILFGSSVGLETISLKGTIFENRVMGVMAAAAVAAVQACGPDPGAVEKAVKAFEPLPHRMREIAVINDVRFVDDSKATNLAALYAGLEMTQGAIRLIAGGMLKERNLRSTGKLLEEKVRKAYLIGSAASKLSKAWKDVVQCCRCRHLEEAVWTAWRDAKAEETVLLSPGCASFDQFINFEDRGNQFINIVKALQKRGDTK